MRKNVKRLGAATLALPLAIGVVAVSSYAAADSAESASTDLRIMSWNIQGGQSDMDLVAAQIKEYDPDIVTLQEVLRCPSQDQVWVLADELGMEPHFGPSDHPSTCLGDDGEEGMAGNAVLTKFSIEKRVTIDLPHDPDLNTMHRTMAGTNIDLGNGQSVPVFTTHLTHGWDNDARVALRKAQGQAAVDYLDHEGPLVFTGDINEAPDKPVPGLIVDAGFTDTGAEVADDPTHNGIRIDYIYTKNATPTWGDVPSPDTSDHRPVIIDMTIDG